MRPQGATYWRIGGRSGWTVRTKQSDLAVSDAHGLRLAADPQGPLSLDSAEGTAGGLVLPRTMTFDETNLLYLLVGNHVRRFDPETRHFHNLPAVGGIGHQPRHFFKPSSITISGHLLYVADTGNRRVQVFDLASLALVQLIDDTGIRAEWSPKDVVAHAGCVYILDSAKARVFRRTRTGHVCIEFEAPSKVGQWSRILIDRNGELYLLNLSQPEKPVLDRRDPQSPQIPDAGSVRDLFDPPPIRFDEQMRFCLPEPLARVCSRSRAEAPSSEMALGLCPPFDRPSCPGIANPGAALQRTRTAQGDWLLYVVDRQKLRANAYTAHGRHLRHSWGVGMDWQPSDVAAGGQFAFILDEKNQAIYRHHAGYDTLRLIVSDHPPHFDWSRIAVDECHNVFAWALGQSEVQAFDSHGTPRGNRPYSIVASYFEVQQPPAPLDVGTGLIFDAKGTPIASIDTSAPIATPLYFTSGAWQSIPLDSLQYRCQWHRIELALSSFPPSSRIDVFTFAHQNPTDVLTAGDDAWQHAHTLIAPVNPQSCESTPEPVDFLVQSGSGQFLSLRINLRGDGFHTPAVDNIKVHYPRESYLQYLPATYSADDESRIFLEHFLAIFQTEWDRFDQIVSQVQRYFDPDAAPAGPFLEYLAMQWLGLTLEKTWTADQKRRYISAAPKIFPVRGTLGGLRNLVAVYLANFTGSETDDILATGFPLITEGFRERRYLFANQGDASRLGQSAPLWSDSVAGRLQLGAYSQVGQAVLVSTGDPSHDMFNRTANRFGVNFPASWLRSKSDEIMLRRAIDSDKPAQTSYDLNLVEARFRVGTQSTVGIDTIIGEFPATRLAGQAQPDLPSSLHPTGRLGYDTLLSGPGSLAMQLTPSVLLGAQSTLT